MFSYFDFNFNLSDFISIWWMKIRLMLVYLKLRRTGLSLAIWYRHLVRSFSPTPEHSENIIINKYSASLVLWRIISWPWLGRSAGHSEQQKLSIRTHYAGSRYVIISLLKFYWILHHYIRSDSAVQCSGLSRGQASRLGVHCCVQSWFQVSAICSDIE